MVIVAYKLKKPLSELPPSKSIKDLVGGKSALQNEILGDLANEFGNVLGDKAEDLTLGEVGSSIQSTYSGALGKTSLSLINKMVSSKMPAGFAMKAIKAYLSSTFGLGPKRSDSTLLHGLVLEPTNRLASDVEARTWLDSVANSYAAKVGLSFASSADASGGNSGATVTINLEEFNIQKLRMDSLIRSQLEQYAKFLDIDLLEGTIKSENVTGERDLLQSKLDLWTAEHGDEYEDGIKPYFTKLKVRVFDSYWNWARQDALKLYYDFIFGRITSVDRDLMNQCIQLMNRAEDEEK
jgi:fatty acid synthase subunit alpha, fungi type